MLLIDSALSDFDSAIHVKPSHFESYRMIDYILAREKKWESIIDKAEAVLDKIFFSNDYGEFISKLDTIGASKE